jgi:hypothetical protein
MRIINAVADLWQQIHRDLRIQHPEWVPLNGESAMCDAYEARLMDLLALVSNSPSDARPNGRASDIRVDAAMIFARADFAGVYFKKPIHLTGADCRAARKLETGWLMAQALLRSQPDPVWQLARARQRRRPPNQLERTC